MNIQSFSMISAAYFNPTAYGDLTGANGWVWRMTHVLVDMKFMAIFSMLFGAGIILMASRAESRGQAVTGVHYRRMAWLIVFGLLHAHLLWYGDILATAFVQEGVGRGVARRGGLHIVARRTDNGHRWDQRILAARERAQHFAIGRASRFSWPPSLNLLHW